MPKPLEELFGAEERAKRGSDAEAEILWEMVCRLRALDELIGNPGHWSKGKVASLRREVRRILDGETE